MQKLKDVLTHKREQNRARNLEKRFNDNRSWTDQHKELKQTVVPLSYLLNIASAFGAMYAIYFAFQFLANSIVIALIICAALLFGIERLKRSTYRAYFDKMVMEDDAPTLFIAVVFLVVLSLGSTAFGVYQGTFDFAPKASTIQSDTTLTYLQNEAAALDGNIQASQRTTWKGKITRKSQDAIKRYSDSQSTLYNAIADRLGMIDKENKGITANHRKDVQNAAYIVLAIALIIEIALLMSMYFLSKFDSHQYYEITTGSPPPHAPTTTKKKRNKRKAKKSTVAPPPSHAPHAVSSPHSAKIRQISLGSTAAYLPAPETIQTTDNQQLDENRTNTNENRSEQKTVIVKGAKLRRCKHCDCEYIYKHNKQKYCSDTCRRAAWMEKKTA